MIPVLPGWVRAVGNVSDGDRTELACRAGGALAFVGIALDSPSAHSGCWLDRLALRAAAVTVALGGRTEGEAEIRDAWHLTRPDQDAGPAGRTFGLWRRLAGRSAPLAEPDLLVAAAQGLGCRTAEAAGECD